MKRNNINMRNVHNVTAVTLDALANAAAAENIEPLTAAEILETLRAYAATERIRRNGQIENETLTDTRANMKAADFIDYIATRYNITSEHIAPHIRAGYTAATNLTARKMISLATKTGNTEFFPWIDKSLFDDAVSEARAAFGEICARYPNTFAACIDTELIETRRGSELRLIARDAMTAVMLSNVIRAIYRAADSVLSYRARHAALTFESMQNDNGGETYRDIISHEYADTNIAVQSVAESVRAKLTADEMEIMHALADGNSKKEICWRFNIGHQTPYTRAQIERGAVSEYPKYTKFMYTDTADGKVFVCSLTRLNRIIDRIKRKTASLAVDARAVLHAAIDESESGGQRVYKSVSPDHCGKLEYLHAKKARAAHADYIKESRIAPRKMPTRAAYIVPKAYDESEYRKARRRNAKAAFETMRDNKTFRGSVFDAPTTSKAVNKYRVLESRADALNNKLTAAEIDAMIKSITTYGK